MFLMSELRQSAMDLVRANKYNQESKPTHSNLWMASDVSRCNNNSELKGVIEVVNNSSVLLSIPRTSSFEVLEQRDRMENGR